VIENSSRILDINDLKLLELANRMEDIYKAISKSTDQFKATANLPGLTTPNQSKMSVYKLIILL
jgi:hypothetical protein